MKGGDIEDNLLDFDDVEKGEADLGALGYGDSSKGGVIGNEHNTEVFLYIH
jgi:hypothetical protein